MDESIVGKMLVSSYKTVLCASVSYLEREYCSCVQLKEMSILMLVGLIGSFGFIFSLAPSSGEATTGW